MPPPPVAGAAVGTGLAVGLADGLAEELAAGLGDVVEPGDVVVVGVAVGLAPALAVGVGEPDAPGEIGGGVAEGEDPEQAERATEVRTTKAAQTTVRQMALTCDGLFITGCKATRSECPREEAGPARALAPSRTP